MFTDDRRWWALIVPMGLLCLMLCSQDLVEASISLPTLSERPTVDGRLDDPAWSHAHRTAPFVGVQGEPVTPTTTAWLARDGTGLWVGVRCEEPNVDRVRRQVTQRNGRVWLDDAVELFLDVNHDRKTYLHLVMNADGVVYAQRVASPPDPAAVGPWTPWVESATHIGDGYWSVELYLPHASLPGISESSGIIGLNVCRDRHAGGAEQFSCLAPTHGSFHTPTAFLPMTGVQRSEHMVPASAWPRVEAYRQDTRLQLEYDAGLLEAWRELHWSVVLEDAGGRTIKRVAATLETMSIDGLSDQAVYARLLASQSDGTVVGVSEPTRIMSTRDVALSSFQPYFDVESKVEVEYRLSRQWRGRANAAQWSLLDGSGKSIAVGDVDGVSADGDFAVDIATIEPGEYAVLLTVIDGRGRQASGRVDFTKLPRPDHITRVTYNEQGMLEIDGEPYLPIGLYRIPPNLWGHWLSDTGFNTVHDMSMGAGRFKRTETGRIAWTTTLDEIEANLDRAHALGLKVLFELGVYVKEVYEVEPGEEDGARLREVVSRFRRHPALLGYYLIDEPYVQHYDRAKRAYAMVKQLDPHHPTIAPSLGRSFYYKPTSELVDALAISCYPVPYRPINAVGESLDTARELIGSEKPIWFVPQAVGLRGNESLPTREQLENMTYQAMTRGVSGLIYFAWFGDRSRQSGELAVVAPAFWEALTNLTNDLQAQKRAFFAKIDAEANIKTATGIELTARQDGEFQYLLAVNVRQRDAVVIIDVTRDGAWDDLVEERSFEADASRLEIPLPALGVRLLKRRAAGNYAVQSQFVGSTLVDDKNLLANPSFEAKLRGWSAEGDAVLTNRAPFSGDRCVAMRAASGKTRVISDPIAVEPGQRLFCAFHVRVDRGATGRTVDATVEVLGRNGEVVKVLPLTGPDERVAKDVAWQWMGKIVEMPVNAAAMRVSLGTTDNRGTTSYDAVRVIDERELDRSGSD